MECASNGISASDVGLVSYSSLSKHAYGNHTSQQGGCWSMYDGGVFGGVTRWAVVFLIIFVLFILLVPGGGY